MTGGISSSTTEILEDKTWTLLKYGSLPVKIYAPRLSTINNEVFSFGNILTSMYIPNHYLFVFQGGILRPAAGQDFGITTIFKFNIDEGRWYNQSFHMSIPRAYFGISVVDFKDYSHACIV